MASNVHWYEMDIYSDASLTAAIGRIALPGVMIAHRFIMPGDEDALMPEETDAFASTVIRVRRASGAARIVARELLVQLGYTGCALPKGAGGAPIWPAGILGSMAHDHQVAIAVVSTIQNINAVGIDIEPAEVLPPKLLDLIATPRERLQIPAGTYHGRLLFSIKEAVYKAVYPWDRRFLDHYDVEVDFENRTATVCNGRIVDFNFCIASHIVTLAYVGADQPDHHK
jgi:4'-phosphopantetheinyl transferase EntD